MAAAYIKVYVKGSHVRTFGGNIKEVRDEKYKYENNPNFVLQKHGCLLNDVVVEYYKNK